MIRRFEKDLMELKMKKFFVLILLFSSFLILSAEETVQENPQNQQPAAETAKPDGNQTAESQNIAVDPQQETAAQEENRPAQAAAEEPEPAPQPAEQKPEEKTTEKPETEQKPAEKPEPAEETKPEQVQAEEAKPESETCDCSSAELQKGKKKPQGIYFQPSVGMGIGASIFSVILNTDIDFLLKHTQDDTNIYFGFDVDFRYSPYLDDHPIYEIPVQLNLAFDFKTSHRNIDYVALWFSGGINFAFGYLYYYDYDEDFDGKDKDKTFKIRPAWGMGVDLLFKNNLVLKLGFDGFYGKYPNLICAAGYRF